MLRIRVDKVEYPIQSFGDKRRSNGQETGKINNEEPRTKEPTQSPESMDRALTSLPTISVRVSHPPRSRSIQLSSAFPPEPAFEWTITNGQLEELYVLQKDKRAAWKVSRVD